MLKVCFSRHSNVSGLRGEAGVAVQNGEIDVKGNCRTALHQFSPAASVKACACLESIYNKDEWSCVREVRNKT